ncbi:MAG: bifunctional proline dehydrogenase/L-glutamate gamma-semialdehyde dehydrogenase [Bacteriovoracaceae bacterium]|nr:bifunctional proline dehydrogenase/L-glutamate gamma-semialdehyde dehydrogenase [Bacteriovoracaceae bacterium]
MMSNRKYFDLSVLQIPRINERGFQNNGRLWKVYFYEDHKSVFCDGDGEIMDGLSSVLSAYTMANFKDFKIQIEYSGIMFLVAFFYEEGAIRFYTPRLGWELFILEEMDGCTQEDYRPLMEHVEKVIVYMNTDFPSMMDIVTFRYDLPDFLHDERYFDLEYDLQDVVQNLLVHINSYRPGRFEKIFDFIFSLLARRSMLKVNLLQFLSISLTITDENGEEIKRNLIQCLEGILSGVKTSGTKQKKVAEGRSLPGMIIYLFNVILKVVKVIPPSILRRCVRRIMGLSARKFIAGEGPGAMRKISKRLMDSGRDVCLDFLGERFDLSGEAGRYTDGVVKLIRKFSAYYSKGEKNASELPKGQVSIKLSAFESNFNPNSCDNLSEEFLGNLKKIMLNAVQNDVLVFIDAEQYNTLEFAYDVVERLFDEFSQLREGKYLGFTLQAYLRDGFEHLQKIKNIAKKYNVVFPVRLVKGAYWNEETVTCESMGWNSFQFLNKEETDLHYRQLMVKIMELDPDLQLVVGSHNFVDHSFAEVLRDKYFKNSSKIEHQCLDMTYEALSRAMVKMGWVVRNSVPVGPIFSGMGYLVRRVMENSSQFGILNMMRSHRYKQSLETPIKTHLERKRKRGLVRDVFFTELSSRFFNVPPSRIFLKESGQLLKNAYSVLDEDQSVIDYSDKLEVSGEIIEVGMANNPDRILGRIRCATGNDVSVFLKNSRSAYLAGDWSSTSVVARSAILVRVANIMVVKRNELVALLSRETGWNVSISHDEVNRAIDFLNYYAREELRLTKKNSKLRSKGIFYVTADRHSPFSSPVGMMVAALVSGNTVIVSPSILCPFAMMEIVGIFHEIGLSQDILTLCPIADQKIMEGIFKSPFVAGVAFEGEWSVGKELYLKFFSKTVENELHKLKFKAEALVLLGGKNSMIITANADLRCAVNALVRSAFSRAGQSLAAVSRIIVHESLKEEFEKKLVGLCHEIKMDVQCVFSDSMGPLIGGRDTREKLRLKREAVYEEIKEYNGRKILDLTGEYSFHAGPAIYELNNVRMCQQDNFSGEQINGPMIYVTYFRELSEAVQIFNSQDYIRTGVIYGQSGSDVDYLLKNLEAGNLYVNKPVEAGRVGFFPEGGLKLSRLGPRMGGKGFLRAFHLNYLADSDPVMPENGRGSDYRFCLMKPSGLSVDSRLARVVKVVEVVIQHFGALFQGVYGDNKEILFKYKKWLDKDFIRFYEEPHFLNRIPGEINYSDYRLSGEQALFLAFSECVDFSTFMRFLSAITLGVGVTVVAKNEIAFGWWTTLKELVNQAGISRQNFDVFYPTDELLYSAARESCLSYIIIDGDMSKIESVARTIHQEHFHDRRLKRVMTPYNAPALMDFKQYVSEFTWIRSVSINTKNLGIFVS